MNRSEWQELERLLQAALDHPAEARDEFLDRHCENPTQRREVDELLAAFEQSPAFFEHPPWTAAETLELLAKGRPPVAEIDGYTLRHELGQGGMGTVYYATSEELSPEVVAIKLVPAVLESPSQLARLRRERQILSDLEHANIARLLDGGSTPEGFHYLILEYVEGLPIDVYCDRGELSIERRLELFREVCGAVHYAHQNLVVHRDIKPGNVLVTADGTVKLLDFGIAKLLDDSRELTEELTQAAQRPMTPNYASPEQISGEPVTTNSDVYSLGVLLFQLLTGAVPHRFQGRSVSTMEAVLKRRDTTRPSTAVDRQVAEDPAGEADIHCGLSGRLLERRLEGDLDTIVEVALRHDPARRYRSADALAEDLDRHLKGLPIQARPSSFWYQTSKIVKRHKLEAAAVFSTFLLAIGVAIAMSWQASVIARERDRADLERIRANRASDFMVDLFEVADPFEGAGARLSAQDLADHGAVRIRTTLGDQPEIQAALNDRLGRMYLNMGLYGKARSHLEAAVRGRSGSDAELARSESLRHLAMLDLVEGHYDAAERGLEQTLAILRAAPAGREGELGITQRELARVYSERADYETSQALLEESLENLRMAFGRKSLEVAECLSRLAAVHLEVSRYDLARDMLRPALEISTERLGESHPKVARILNTLGKVMRMQGEPQAAREPLERAIAIYESALGPDHPALAQAINNLAIVRAILGHYDHAEKLFQRALTIYRQTFDGSHVRIADILSNLAVLADLRGRHELAIESYREAGAMYQQLFGPDHEHVASVNHNLATLYLEDGELELAEQYGLRALATYREVLGEGSDRTVEMLGVLGELAYYRGDADTAGKLMEQTIEIYTKASQTHPHLPWALRWSSLVDQVAGRHQAARPKLERALELRRETLDPLHVEVLEIELDWASWLLATGGVEAARELLQEMLARCEVVDDEEKLSDPDFISRLARIHLLLAETGPAAGGNRHLSRAVELLRKIPRPSLLAQIDLVKGLRGLNRHREAELIARRLQGKGIRMPDLEGGWTQR